MKLLVIQKNELYDIITGFNLSPSLFEFKEAKSTMTDNEVATVLLLKNSQFAFIFETLNEKHFIYFSPGTDTFKSEAFPETWGTLLGYFQNWVSTLLYEIKSEDKWERLQNEIKGLNIKYSVDASKFSAHEFEVLKTNFNSIKSQITKIGLTVEQAQVIESKLDHLLELAKDMNKFDWKNLFIGTIISIIIQLGITPDNASNLWKIIKQIFSNYFLP